MQKTVFTHAEAVRRFTLGQNKRVENWIARNWERLSLSGPVHKATVSNALNSKPISEELVRALNTLYSEMRDDPWAFCEPPNRLELLDQYAPLAWWYETLELQEIPLTMWKRIKTHELTPERQQIVKRQYDDWYRRLRAACDRFKADSALVRALEADDDPEYQTFYKLDGEWYTGDEQPYARSAEERTRRRVGNPGLHGHSLEDIGMAIALEATEITLPDVERAQLTYSRPQPVPLDQWNSEPIDPWMGDTFEGVESRFTPLDKNEWEGEHCRSFQTKSRVLFYWDGSRYAVEDVEPFVQFKKSPSDKWSDATPQQRDFLITGLKRNHQTREELEACRDEWIADVWEGQKESWENREYGSPFNRQDYPDGVPRECAEEAFERHLGRVDQEAALAELREIERRRRKFMRTLRRRPKGVVSA